LYDSQLTLNGRVGCGRFTTIAITGRNNRRGL